MRIHCFFRLLGIALVFVFEGCQATRNLADHAPVWIPWVHRSSHPKAAASQKAIRTHGLALTLQLEPLPVLLSETRRVEATLRLENVSSRFIQLEFPTTQRFDVVVRDAAGKPVAQWSEDRVFETEPGYVGINPAERLEYRAAFSTRELQPGKRYTVTAFFPNREDLKVELPFTPEK
ncbi:MAG: BsuPI-related putative proteinase inhibitor [Verrucomicrobia bacterium]|nr:BsuPI-related putative proteinase inhibitor [Verrucomicrobiota bacterium]